MASHTLPCSIDLRLLVSLLTWNFSAMESLTPSEGLLGYGNMSKTGKRAGALGSLAGAG